MNLFERQESRIRGIAGGVRSGRPENLESGGTTTHTLQAVADELGESAILVRIPQDLDKSAYVPLAIARQCGADFIREVGKNLATNPAAALDVLSEAVSSKYLLIDGSDELYRSAFAWDLGGALEPLVKPVRDWVERHASVSTRSPARRTTKSPVREQPRPDKLWAANVLWSRVEQDPDRYVLAVARQLLRNPADDASLGWDVESLISDLWQWMPSDLRDLVGMLATHHRPAIVADLERLGLSAHLVETAITGYLVERQRDQLWLPKPWYAMSANLEPLEVQKDRHRRWADAFSRQILEEGVEGAPFAVLEAHRHYALIPDVPRARAFARFGASVLLEAAVRQSKMGAYSDASTTYETVLSLAGTAGVAVDARMRGYARHYFHYNRAQCKAESIQETQRGYEEALLLWPENALFWSRLIRNKFLANDEEGAMGALAKAWDLVPEHPERSSTLVVRTVDRLLGRGLVLPALFVWDDHASESGFDAAVESKLHWELEHGVLMRRLWAPGLPAIDLPDAMVLRIERVSEPTPFRGVAGHVMARGATREEAARSAVRGLIVETLADSWYRETGHKSVLGARFKHPAWQQIVALGTEAIPDILRRIERTAPSHLFHALDQITGEHPLPPGTAATVAEACNAWLTWGREHGYEW